MDALDEIEILTKFQFQQWIERKTKATTTETIRIQVGVSQYYFYFNCYKLSIRAMMYCSTDELRRLEQAEEQVKLSC